MKDIKLVWGIVSLAFSLASCGSLVQDVPDSRVPQEPQKPVIVGFISPQDSLLAVSVKLTQTVLGTQPFINNGVPNAVVTLSNGQKFIALSFVQNSDGVYSAPARNFPIIAGQTYQLSVSMPSGQTLTSSAKVPEAVAITNTLFDSSKIVQGYQSYKYTVRIGWKDPAGQPNYYRIMGDQVNTQTIPTGPNGQTATFTNINPVYFENEEPRYVLTDNDADGNQFTSSRGTYAKTLIANINGKQTNTPAGPLTLSLLSTDKAYYLYHEALNRYRATEGNPFAEPVLLPSNIQGGGLGCFAAYNGSSLKIVPK